MKIHDVIRSKGTEVVTISPDETVESLVQLLHDKNIGAAVVCTADRQIVGIVSERDLLHSLATQGATILTRPVSSIMTQQVFTVALDDRIEEAAHEMTYRRIRHVPVLIEGALGGIVSMGDLVKHRIDQLTDERNHLLGYLHA